jgi:hypothetical protein
LFACCVFLQVDESVYLVTARHALKGVATELMTRGRSYLFDVVGRGGMAQGINGEEFDIAALSISSAMVDVHALRAIPPSMLATAVEVDNPQSRAFCGFPVSRNDRAVALGVRPVRASSTICRLNSGVYRTELSAIVNASKTNLGVSTKPGQVQRPPLAMVGDRSGGRPGDRCWWFAVGWAVYFMATLGKAISGPHWARLVSSG